LPAAAATISRRNRQPTSEIIGSLRTQAGFVRAGSATGRRRQQDAIIERITQGRKAPAASAKAGVTSIERPLQEDSRPTAIWLPATLKLSTRLHGNSTTITNKLVVPSGWHPSDLDSDLTRGSESTDLPRPRHVGFAPKAEVGPALGANNPYRKDWKCEDLSTSDIKVAGRMPSRETLSSA
jgi:hypothetical protein